MVVLIVESAPPGLRGQLSKWMLEPKAGVFVGTLSAAVRDRLWEKACKEVEEGGATLIYRTDNEQGYAIRSFGDTTRQIEEWEGLFLVRRPNPTPPVDPTDPPPAPPDWDAMLYPSIWAKTDRGVERKAGEPSWHPLICHMVDVAMVALRLWQYLLPPAVKEQMRVSLGVPTFEDAGRWIAFFAGLHDLGKASPGFAFKWSEGAERLQAEGFKPATTRKSSPHGYISAHLLGELLPTWEIHPGSAMAIGYAVGGHHGIFPDPLSMEAVEESVGGKRWQKAQGELAALLAHMLRIDELPVPTGALLPDSPFLMRLAGLTSVADWIGSNHRYFPFAGDAVRLPHYPRRARWRALKALIDLGWFHRPGRVEPLSFHELFSFLPNRLQAQVEQVAAHLSGPSLVLLEYPMGGGKTEGALYLANALQAKAGQQGLYMALPTMATSNHMFKRVADYLANRFPGDRINLQLLHGRADLNPAFARLLQRGLELPEPPVIEDEQDLAANLLAAEWFTHKKQALLAPFGIGTVDQALLAALETKHYFVRLFGLAGKVVVLDEVHAYDTYMQTLLGHLLMWLAACGSSVILLSATLPSRTRQDLLAAFSRGLGQAGLPAVEPTPYPRITWLSGGVARAQSIEGVPRRSISLRSFEVNAAEWMAALRQQLEAGGCAAVLCNTVSRAQETYEALRGYFSPDELLLFHARYPFDDRMERETAVIERFGKKGDGRPHRMVCVATQVIEQSLDIDFDLMVTDLAPVDLVLQRAGRIWRHNRPERPAHFVEPALWLLMPALSPEGIPLFDRASTKIYEAHLLLRSYLALRALPALIIPDGVEDLIEEVYQPARPPEDSAPALAAYWEKTAQQMLQADHRDKRKAAIREIPTLDVELIDHRSMALDEDSEEVHTAHQAMTRLGGPSVEVVCLYDRQGDTFLTLNSPTPVDLRRRPDREGVLALLGRSLRLSFDPGLAKQILALPVPVEWEATAHLRRHRLLRFTPDGRCLTADLPLGLDPVLGLRKRSPETEVDM